MPFEFEYYRLVCRKKIASLDENDFIISRELIRKIA